MAVKFFGQFLIESMEIDSPALRSALDLMESENLTLGELAVAAGFASEADCRRVNGEQRRLDRPFGELAQEMGVLNSIELEELLQNQLETRINIGEALVRLGHLTRERLCELDDGFKQEQALVPPAGVILPKELQANRLAKCLVEILPRYCMRMSRMQVSLGEAEPIHPHGSELNLVSSLVMVGRPGIEIHLLSDLPFARKLSAGIAQLPPEHLNAELCLDGLGEFLNVAAGNAMSNLEKVGLEFRLESPRYGRFPDTGFWFELASEWGRAAVTLSES
jgi:hypothetical protein